ncbi:MAG: DUF4404 family protein [Planctomycetota bacterium]|nr:DUF4404 family protein [Planctomycetota bacterium]
MTSQRLRQIVDELHTELEQHSLDEEGRSMLRDTLKDLVVHLDARDASAAAEPSAEGEPMVPNAIDGLDEAYARFRDEHPALATGVQRLIDLLNQSGI